MSTQNVQHSKKIWMSRKSRYVAGMVTRRRRLFLKEHREAHGVSAAAMADRLGIERESLYRLEREAMTRLNGQKQAAYASALGIEPETLWQPPGDRG
jgi:lambda repressor-like predicted transcriptional regulator